jgi:hypothetical protein
MRCFRFPRPSLRATAIAVLGFAVLGLVAERSVDAASCGHYVKRLGPGFIPGKAVTSYPLNAGSAETPWPCRGPECHRSPQLPTPLAPNAPVRISAPQDLLAIADRTLVLSRPHAWLSGEFSARPLRGYPSRLDRPPIL